MKKKDRILIAAASGVFLATIAGLIFYKMSKEEELDYYNEKIKKIKNNFRELADNYREKRESKKDQTPPFEAHDEFGIFL